MINFRRLVYTALVFLGLLAPFVLVWFLTMSTTKPSSNDAPTQVAAQTGPSVMLSPATSQPVALAPDTPLLMAGDGKTLWLVRPVLLEGKSPADARTPAFELIQRTSNSPQWLVTRIGSMRYFTGIPRGLAVVSPRPASKAKASVAVLLDDGRFYDYSLDDYTPLTDVPGPSHVLATVGSNTGLFALARGPAAPPVATRPASRPAARLPESSATRPALESITAWWLHDGQWQPMPALGKPGEVAPDPARTALAYLPGRLLLVSLVPPAGGATQLSVRALPIPPRDSGWSAAVVSDLPDAVPAGSSLLALTVDQSVYVLWAVAAGDGLELRGGRLLTNSALPGDLTLPPHNRLPSMPLGQASAGANPARDVVVAPTENALMVVVADRQAQLSALKFDDHGKSLTPAAPIDARPAAHNAMLLQNIAMLVLVALMALALWQWRNRPAKPAVPESMRVARIYQRLLGFIIDLAIPMGIVVAVSFIRGGGGFVPIFAAWWEGVWNPEAFTHAPELLYALAAYLLHVTIGELFWGRSLGKAIVGVRVIMLDGKPPTVWAILLRNLIRIPELLSGVLLIYLFISEYRQRLGDLLARTLVVAPRGPDDAPEDTEPRERKAK